ncbi:hypothetical protein [Brevibacterium sp. SMBL_HHYL_HB1]|uniref:hypothetical protein n=1 Tax=Brevibacterium sp. SMBL_HHYL_HB1 TaxID=2777556 RepID=UPI001BA5163B|nr:hypothetical protein [Brevibacterium sp. SMBL_HHYL_HB1]QUL80267.1 hypothetical protein IG171_05550 [Brevibacterium sp. SMBL_HHYL_HB1]
MIDGSIIIAGLRYKDRLSTGSARMGIPERLSQVDGAPDVQQIALWLGQLSDQKVLDRVLRLTTPRDYGSDAALHIVEVIKGLRDRVPEFIAGGPSVIQNSTAIYPAIRPSVPNRAASQRNVGERDDSASGRCPQAESCRFALSNAMEACRLTCFIN